MNDEGKPQNDPGQPDERARELIEQLNLLEAVDRRITPEHAAQRFHELLISPGFSSRQEEALPAGPDHDAQSAMRGKQQGRPMRLVLCDDNRILCEALSVALTARGYQVLATATTSTRGIAEVASHRPDLVLFNLRFPDPSDGLGAARIIRERYPETAVLLLCDRADPAVAAEATRIGVSGVLSKDQNIDHLAGALDVIWSGGVVFGPVQAHPARDLTSREKEVLRRIAAGQSTGQMSREMNVATSTLRTYVRSILTKLGVHTRVEAAVLATRENLLSDRGVGEGATSRP